MNRQFFQALVIVGGASLAWGALGVIGLDGAEPPPVAVRTVNAFDPSRSICFAPDPTEATVVPEPFRLSARYVSYELQAQSASPMTSVCRS